MYSHIPKPRISVASSMAVSRFPNDISTILLNPVALLFLVWAPCFTSTPPSSPPLRCKPGWKEPTCFFPDHLTKCPRNSSDWRTPITVARGKPRSDCLVLGMEDDQPPTSHPRVGEEHWEKTRVHLAEKRETDVE